MYIGWMRKRGLCGWSLAVAVLSAATSNAQEYVFIPFNGYLNFGAPTGVNNFGDMVFRGNWDAFVPYDGGLVYWRTNDVANSSLLPQGNQRHWILGSTGDAYASTYDGTSFQTSATWPGFSKVGVSPQGEILLRNTSNGLLKIVNATNTVSIDAHPQAGSWILSNGQPRIHHLNSNREFYARKVGTSSPIEWYSGAAQGGTTWPSAWSNAVLVGSGTNETGMGYVSVATGSEFSSQLSSAVVRNGTASIVAAPGTFNHRLAAIDGRNYVFGQSSPTYRFSFNSFPAEDRQLTPENPYRINFNGVMEPLQAITWFPNDFYAYTLTEVGAASRNGRVGVAVNARHLNGSVSAFMGQLVPMEYCTRIFGDVSSPDVEDIWDKQYVSLYFSQAGVLKHVLSYRAQVDGSFDGYFPYTGTYDVQVRFRKFLRKNVGRVSFGSVGFAAFTAELLGGDADGDNIVSILDYIALSSHFGKTSSASDWNTNTSGATPNSCDFDYDGEVSILDYVILSTNFDKEGDPF